MIDEREKEEIKENDWEIVDDKNYTKCNNCPLRRVCIHAYENSATYGSIEEARCYYEIEGKLVEKRRLFNRWQAFVSSEPEYFMEKLMMNYETLEEEARNDFNFAKGLQLNYLLMSLYRMKFGEKKEVSVENRVSNTSADIKALVDQMRKEKEQSEDEVETV